MKSKKHLTTLLFLILLFGISVLYKYHEIAFKRPQSVHKWRQSDCASIALNYYQGGMNFFKVETHNLTSDGGTSGKSCTSEIPVLYYTVATLYSVFGYHEYIYRIFNTLLFFLGLFYLFRLLRILLKDLFWSVTLTLLFFTSPVLVFYGNNFLSNSSALAFSIVAWYYFILFLSEGKTKWFYISIAVFLIAAAFKVTALFSLFAISGIFLLELAGLKKFDKTGKLFNRPLQFIIPVLSALLIIGAWIIYAKNYNLKHDCSYFSTTIFPIWDLNSVEIASVWENIRKLWLDQYFHISVLLFLALCFMLIVALFRKNNPVLIYSVIFIFAEAIVYILLQFWTFKDHDYYIIDMYILPVLIVVTAFDLLKKHYNKIFSSIPLKIVFSLFLLYNIYYAHVQINARYDGWMNDYTERSDIYSITPYLRQIGISQSDTIISIPDFSNVSLYLMNQKGWTEYIDAKFNRGTKVPYNQDSAGIQSSIDKGARYLIINGIKELYNKTYLQSFCTNLAGRYNNVLIFNLRERTRNFTLEQRQIEKIYRCNAECLSADGLNFLNEFDSTLFQSGTTRSDLFARNGKYSSRLHAFEPYGMGIKLKDLKFGESFVITVWKKGKVKSKAGIVVSSSPNPYYNYVFNPMETDSGGWEKILMEFSVPAGLINQELGIYLHNPDTDTVYFDDLEIIRYDNDIPI
jgi:hypothetical protein